VGEDGLQLLAGRTGGGEEEPECAQVLGARQEWAVAAAGVSHHGCPERPHRSHQGPLREEPGAGLARGVGGERRLQHVHQPLERLKHLAGDLHLGKLCLEPGERRTGKRHLHRRGPGPERSLQQGPPALGTREARGDEGAERDPVGEGEEQLGNPGHHLREKAVAGEHRGLQQPALHRCSLLQLALVQRVQHGAQEHVAAVEDLIQEGVAVPEHSLLEDVPGAAGLGQHLEVNRAEQVGLHRAFGELPGEERGLAVLLDDAAQNRVGERALRRSGRSGEKHVLPGEQRKRELLEDRLALEERGALSVEEGLKGAGVRCEVAHAGQGALHLTAPCPGDAREPPRLRRPGG
jgi:hypothetical protein